MPIAQIKCVREVSSEDPVHEAANLLSSEVSKKWKTKSVGEKSAYVILEFEEPHEITGIDIGNEHSAFVEVFVGKTGNSDDDFTEILITCSFMTPIESKNSTNTNRVRCFGKNALVESKLTTKWKLIKVFCTQPFNKHVQFGLSFIRVHVSENTNKTNHSLKAIVPENLKRSSSYLQNQCEYPKRTKSGLGKFSLREYSPDSDSECVESLFSRWKMNRAKKVDASLSIASAIREASSPNSLRRMNDNDLKSKHTLKIPCSRSQREDCPIKPHIIADNNRNGANQSVKLLKKNQRTRLLNPEMHEDSKMKNTVEEFEFYKVQTIKKLNSTSAGKIGKNIKFRPFSKLLEGVVLVISGIQNPNRADLRNKALAMGAKYKADWESGCTHLICAFKNTPKYNQVRAKGKIVTSKWIEKCYESKKYLPWRRFALDNEEFDKPESDEEIFDDSGRHLLIDEFCNKKERDDPDMTMVYLTEDNRRKLDIEVLGSSSESDTDDDIKRAVSTNLQRKMPKQKPNISPNKDDETEKRESIYEVLTEEEDFLKDKYMSN